jgi:hypothetical protein
MDSSPLVDRDSAARVNHLSSALTPAAVLAPEPRAAGQVRRTPRPAAASCSRLLGGGRATSLPREQLVLLAFELALRDHAGVKKLLEPP